MKANTAPTHHTLRQKTPPHTKKNNLPYIAFSAIAYITKNSLLSKNKIRQTTKTNVANKKYIKKTARSYIWRPRNKKISPHYHLHKKRAHVTNFVDLSSFSKPFFVIISFLESKTTTKSNTQFSVESTVFTWLRKKNTIAAVNNQGAARLDLINQLLFSPKLHEAPVGPLVYC